MNQPKKFQPKNLSRSCHVMILSWKNDSHLITIQCMRVRHTHSIQSMHFDWAEIGLTSFIKEGNIWLAFLREEKVCILALPHVETRLIMTFKTWCPLFS